MFWCRPDDCDDGRLSRLNDFYNCAREQLDAFDGGSTPAYETADKAAGAHEGGVLQMFRHGRCGHGMNLKQ